jgi:phage-related minor tail protein
MAGKIKGITIEIGGDTQKLNKALEDVNKKTRDVQSELRQVERLLKLDPGNTDLLAQKQKLLAEAVENSREKLDRLKTAQEQVNEQFRKGEINEEQYRAFQREVVKAEQELEKFEKQLRETGLTAEQVGKKLQDAGQKMTDVGKDLSLKVTAPIVAAGAASFKMAADLQDAMGATEQIYKDAADSVKDWADNLESYYGIAEGEALEYANMMGSMLVNIGGLTEEQAAKQAATLIELAGDLTAMYGGTTADAVRALTGALKGNNTMLDNYGMAANDAMIKTKALEMGLYDGTGQMDLATKQAATLALIMEQTGAAQGQAAREAEGASGGMRAFATEIKNLATDIGEVLLPVITPLLANLNNIVKKFGDLSPEMKKAIVIVAGLAAAIGPLLIVLGMMASGLGAIVGILPVLGTALTVLTGPVGIVVAAIAGLIAIGVLLYKNWDEIAAFGIKMWDDLKAKFQDSINAIKDLWQGFKDSLTDTWKGLWGGVQNVFDGIKTVLTNATTKLTDDMLVRWEKFKGGIINIWSAITGSIKGYINNMIGFVNKLIDALNSIKVEIPDWVPGFGGQKFGIDLPHIPALATGTNYVPRDMLAYLHKGEAVVPAKYNPQNTPTTVIKEIHIHGNNADEIWSKFERNLHKLGVVF